MPFLIPIIIAIATVASIISTVIKIIQTFKPPEPGKISFGFTGSSSGSPRYGSFGPLDNTVSNELAVPILYGQLKIGGNVIWQTKAGETVSRIVGLCEGEINAINDVRANDVVIEDTANQTPGSNYTKYLGTGTQDADSRLPVNLRPDMNLRNTAYIALTLATSDKIKGGNPALTSICQGLLIETWTGITWTTVKTFSRNPAACVRDLLINARYGLGLAKTALDEASFGAMYDFCEGKVTNLDSMGNSANQAPSGSIVFLAHCDSASPYLDSSPVPKTTTISGLTSSDTSIFKIGNGSVRIPEGAYFFSQKHADFNLGSDDFTFECQVMFSAFVEGAQTFIALGKDQSYLQLYRSSATNTFRFDGAVSGLTAWDIVGTTTISLNTWYHVAGVRSGSVFKLFVNGVKEGPDATFTGTLFTDVAVHVGRQDESRSVGIFDGWVDEIKLVQGAALYNNNVVTAPDDNEARFRFDYIIDSQRPAADVLNDMLSSFMGFLVYAGSKIKLRIEKAEDITQYFGDGSQNAANATFDPDNILKDSMSWNLGALDDKPNRIRLQWVDPNQNYVKVYAQVEDRIDQDSRGTIITKDVSLLAITRQTQALRMAKLYMNLAKYANINITFAARLDSIHCEIGDVIAVTHQSSKFTRRLFRITDMQEGEDETIQINAKEYNASIFDDRMGAGIQVVFQPPGPNPYAPLGDVT